MRWRLTAPSRIAEHLLGLVQVRLMGRERAVLAVAAASPRERQREIAGEGDAAGHRGSRMLGMSVSGRPRRYSPSQRTSNNGRSRMMDRYVARAVAVAATMLAGSRSIRLRSLATKPTPVALDAPDNGNTPLVAYDPTTQATYVAWSAPDNQNGGNGVDLCVLPAGASGCEGGAPGAAHGHEHIGRRPRHQLLEHGQPRRPRDLPGSNEAVVLGTPVQTGTVAWASPAGSGFLTATRAAGRRRPDQPGVDVLHDQQRGRARTAATSACSTATTISTATSATRRSRGR